MVIIKGEICLMPFLSTVNLVWYYRKAIDGKARGNRFPTCKQKR